MRLPPTAPTLKQRHSWQAWLRKATASTAGVGVGRPQEEVLACIDRAARPLSLRWGAEGRWEGGKQAIHAETFPAAAHVYCARAASMPLKLAGHVSASLRAGFVFVQSRLERRTRKAAGGAGGGKGFGATAIKEQSESAGEGACWWYACEVSG